MVDSSLFDVVFDEDEDEEDDEDEGGGGGEKDGGGGKDDGERGAEIVGDVGAERG